VSWLVKAEPIIAATVKDFKIHIVGRCADSSYKRLISDQSRFVITEEFVPHEAVAGIFRAASVVVLPYLSATQPGVIPLAYGFWARVLTGPTLSPLGQLATRVVAPRLPVEPKLVPGPPKRFAQASK